MRWWHHQLTHLHIHIDWSRNVLWKFAKTSKCHNFLIFQPIFIRFSLLCFKNFYSFFLKFKLNLFRISPLNFIPIVINLCTLRKENLKIIWKSPAFKEEIPWTFVMQPSFGIDLLGLCWNVILFAHKLGQLNAIINAANIGVNWSTTLDCEPRNCSQISHCKQYMYMYAKCHSINVH